MRIDRRAAPRSRDAARIRSSASWHERPHWDRPAPALLEHLVDRVTDRDRPDAGGDQQGKNLFLADEDPRTAALGAHGAGLAELAALAFELNAIDAVREDPDVGQTAFEADPDQARRLGR